MAKVQTTPTTNERPLLFMCPQLVHTTLFIRHGQVRKTYTLGLFSSLLHRPVVFSKLQTRTTTAATEKKNPWKTMGALGFYCAYNTFCTCGHFMTISTYRLCNLWYIPASIPSSYQPRHCATQTPWLWARAVFFVVRPWFRLCQIRLFFLSVFDDGHASCAQRSGVCCCWSSDIFHNYILWILFIIFRVHVGTGAREGGRDWVQRETTVLQQLFFFRVCVCINWYALHREFIAQINVMLIFHSILCTRKEGQRQRYAVENFIYMRITTPCYRLKRAPLARCHCDWVIARK